MAVSVTATVLNEIRDIEGLVSSLANQRLAPDEIIVVDGGSNDGTWEWLTAAKAQYPTLIPIRDESCNLKQSPGPIARGRNVGIAAATSEVVACTDAGCTYREDWLGRLTVSILAGTAEYAVGGSCIDPTSSTVWDIASAPFFGIKLDPNEPTKSCTARSMAFRKELWMRVGGFPETVFLGEDTIFDSKVRKLVAPNFAEGAKAIYHPRHTFKSSLSQLASYSITDGVLGVRPARFARNLARCIIAVIAIISLYWNPIPFLCITALECYFAFRLDWRGLQKTSFQILGARLLFSIIVPWIVTWNQLVGLVTKVNHPNRQNILPKSQNF